MKDDRALQWLEGVGKGVGGVAAPEADRRENWRYC